MEGQEAHAAVIPPEEAKEIATKPGGEAAPRTVPSPQVRIMLVLFRKPQHFSPAVDGVAASSMWVCL